MSCRFINYIRNVIRFISVYMVVAITAQRLYIVYRPLSIRFKRKSSAWQTVFAIICFSLIINSWVPFMFGITKKAETNDQYCDIDSNFSSEYFILNIFYVCLIMLVPICMLICGNTLIMFKTAKNDSKRKKRLTLNFNTYGIKRSKSFPVKRPTTKEKKTVKIVLKSYDFKFDRAVNKRRSLRLMASKNMICIILLISFANIFLNLPYFVAWMIFFEKVASNELDSIEKNYFTSYLQIAEIFYILNYAIKFFIFCLKDSLLRNKVKSLRKNLNLNLFIYIYMDIYIKIFLFF